MFRKLIPIGAAAALMATVMAAAPAQAVTYPQYPDVAPETLTFDGATITDQVLCSTTDDTTIVVLSTKSYDQLTESKDDVPEFFPVTSGYVLLGAGSGTGGTTSPSGCRKVTVHNPAHNVLGSTAYVYNTWTSWCWNRDTHVISSAHVGWFLSKVGSQQQWQGEVNNDVHFYTYHTGATRSGYYHYRQGQFTNCVFKFGCVNTTYPTNRLWSHANGTWSWRTSG